jgi:hypothetical protein
MNIKKTNKQMKTKEQTVPKWFSGLIYEEGAKVKNIFSGDEYELNALELSIYDFVMGSQMVFEMAPNSVTQKQINDFQKGLMWFRTNNVDAYFALLD